MSDEYPMSFEKWVAWLFDHPDEAELDDMDYDDPWREEQHREKTIQYITKLWSKPDIHLAAYSDEQIGKGLERIVSCGSTAQLLVWFSKEVDANTKTALIDSVEPLYRRLFEPRCRQALGHRSEEQNALEGLCYMIWDISPVCPGLSLDYERNPLIVELDKRLIDVLDRCLTIDHLSCQESILHGLGHGVNLSVHSAAIQRIIDRYLDRSGVDPRLLLYARRAREGMVQ